MRPFADGCLTARQMPSAASDLRAYNPPLSARPSTTPDMTPRIHFSLVTVPPQAPQQVPPTADAPPLPTPRSRTIIEHHAFPSPRSFRSAIVGERISHLRDVSQPARIVPPQQPRTAQYARVAVATYPSPCIATPAPPHFPNVGALRSEGWVQCEVGRQSALRKVHRHALLDRQWAFAYLKLSGWVLHLWASEQASKCAKVQPDAWFDLRACRAVDSYQTVELDREVYPNAVVCIFARGRLEFRTRNGKESRDWMDLIRRVQFESHDQECMQELREPRLRQLEPLLMEVMQHHKRGISPDVFGRIFDLYSDSGEGLSLADLIAVLRDLLEIRKRRLDTFISLQYRIVNAYARQGANGTSTSFALFQKKADALSAKYREKQSVASLGTQAVNVQTFCDGDRNGIVDKKEFVQAAAMTIFTAKDIQEELDVRRLGQHVGQDNCLTQ